MNKKALIEVLKSAGRFLWFGFLALVIVALTAIAADENVVNAYFVVNGVGLNVGFILVAVIGVVIKAIDRYIHVNKSIELNGLAPSVLQK